MVVRLAGFGAGRLVAFGYIGWRHRCRRRGRCLLYGLYGRCRACLRRSVGWRCRGRRRGSVGPVASGGKNKRTGARCKYGNQLLHRTSPVQKTAARTCPCLKCNHADPGGLCDAEHTDAQNGIIGIAAASLAKFIATRTGAVMSYRATGVPISHRTCPIRVTAFVRYRTYATGVDSYRFA